MAKKLRLQKAAGGGFGLTVSEDCLVLKLAAAADGGPPLAAAAGVRPGQRIRRVNGVDVGSKQAIVEALRFSKAEVDFWLEPRRWAVAVPAAAVVAGGGGHGAKEHTDCARAPRGRSKAAEPQRFPPHTCSLWRFCVGARGA
jgi:hypothetical protein